MQGAYEVDDVHLCLAEILVVLWVLLVKHLVERLAFDLFQEFDSERPHSLRERSRRRLAMGNAWRHELVAQAACYVPLVVCRPGVQSRRERVSQTAIGGMVHQGCVDMWEREATRERGGDMGTARRAIS